MDYKQEMWIIHFWTKLGSFSVIEKGTPFQRYLSITQNEDSRGDMSQAMVDQRPPFG